MTRSPAVFQAFLRTVSLDDELHLLRLTAALARRDADEIAHLVADRMPLLAKVLDAVTRDLAAEDGWREAVVAVYAAELGPVSLCDVLGETREDDPPGLTL